MDGQSLGARDGPRQRARAGGALMLLGGATAVVSFFLPWVISTPLRPAPGQPGFATSPWSLVKMGGVEVIFLLLLAAEMLIAVTGGLEFVGRHGPLRPAAIALLCVPGLLATLFLGWITTISANLTASYLVSTASAIGLWLTLGSLLAALGGAVAASTGETGAGPPATTS